MVYNLEGSDGMEPMTTEQALQILREKEKRSKDPFLERFLSSLFRLFDGQLPPSIESNVNALLVLLTK